MDPNVTQRRKRPPPPPPDPPPPQTARRQTLLLRQTRCSFLPKPSDLVWYVPTGTGITEVVLRKLHPFLSRIGEEVGSEVSVLPSLSFKIKEDDTYTVADPKRESVERVLERVWQTPKSMAIGSISIKIDRPSSKGIVYPDPVRHRLTLCVANRHGNVEGFLLDSNGTVERKHDGNWAPRSRAVIESCLGLIGYPIAIQAIATPHVNFVPNRHTEERLRDLNVNEVDTDRAMCRHFAFLFLVELLCTSLQGTTAEHIFRFLHLDIFRRTETGTQLKRDITEMEKVELICYVRALALGVYQKATGKSVPIAQTTRIQRSWDSQNTPTLHAVDLKPYPRRKSGTRASSARPRRTRRATGETSKERPRGGGSDTPLPLLSRSLLRGGRRTRRSGDDKTGRRRRRVSPS